MGDVVSFEDAAAARDLERLSALPDDVYDFVGELQDRYDLTRARAVSLLLACIFGELGGAADAGFEEAQEVLDYFRDEFWADREGDA